MSAAAPKPSASAPYKVTLKEAKEMMAKRRKGLYQTEDTYNEAWLSYTQMEPDDVCFTLKVATGTFAVLNRREFAQQLSWWRDMGIKCQDYNVKEVTFGDKKAWSFVVQPKNLKDAPICPLGICLGTMVSGFTYVAKDKATADLAVRALA